MRAKPWGFGGHKVFQALKGRDIRARSLCRALSGLSRPGASRSQGFALGLYVAPFQGAPKSVRIRSFSIESFPFPSQIHPSRRLPFVSPSVDCIPRDPSGFPDVRKEPLQAVVHKTVLAYFKRLRIDQPADRFGQAVAEEDLRGVEDGPESFLLGLILTSPTVGSRSIIIARCFVFPGRLCRQTANSVPFPGNPNLLGMDRGFARLPNAKRPFRLVGSVFPDE